MGLFLCRHVTMGLFLLVLHENRSQMRLQRHLVIGYIKQRTDRLFKVIVSVRASEDSPKIYDHEGNAINFSHNPNCMHGRIPSSGMLRRVTLLRTDVSEELSASIIRVRTIGELGTLAVTSNCRTLRRNTISSVFL
jgi:hypothetical protein